MSLVACECPPGPGLEPEPCSRARSQACMYLEQIRNRVATGTADVTKRDYLVDAATQIHLALERDVSEDYEAAFNHYQNGVDVLLRGVHVDPNKERREAVKLKITKYLRRAEEIFNCHLQRTLGSGASPNTGFSSLRLRPIRTLSSALEQLKGCRVVGIINPQNLLLDQAGHIQLTYFGQWSEVEPRCSQEAVDCLYSAPEVGGISELTEACDWWSYGSLLYELLTGMALSQSHPSGFQAHTQLQLPEWLSHPAASLLTELLQFEPQRRLGAGGGGTSRLKSHPFFSTIQWSRLTSDF